MSMQVSEKRTPTSKATEIIRILLGVIFTLSCSAPVSGAKTVTYFYTDHQGSVLATTDANGVVTSTKDYKPYGISAMGNSGESLGYTGHVEDSDAGFIYMQARYYDPEVGRFLSPDSATYAPGGVLTIGEFQYAGDNPYKYIDPTGMRSCGGSIDRPECIYGGDQAGPEKQRRPAFPLSQDSEGSQHRSGCDSSECDEVKTTRANILHQQAEALEKAGAFGVREGATMLVGGALGKILGRVAGALGIAERATITFGRNENAVYHAFRHVEAAGLSKSSVQDVVLADIKAVSRSVASGKPYNGVVEVEGVEVTYTAYRLPDGSINIGRITTSGTTP